MLGNFGVLSFLRSWKLTRFLTTCISATSFRIWTFSAFLYISETTRTNFFKISSHDLHNLYQNVWNFHEDWFSATPWNFKTNLSYEPVKNLRYNIHWRCANFFKIMRTIHISMTSTFQCEYCQCFTFKRCDKFKLKCTCHGRMYSAHYFGKVSITSKQ